MSDTSVRNCICDHEFQDRQYSPKRGVHNSGPKKASSNTLKWTCTVCGRSEQARVAKVVDKACKQTETENT